MKTNNYRWGLLAATAVLLAACSSEENEIPQPREKSAKVEIRLTGTTAGTKATGNVLPTQDEENTVKRFTVAIFNTNGSVNAIQTVASNTASATTINCTPASNCTGMVVANAPSDNYFAGVLTKTDFLKKVIALTNAQTKDALPMSGDVKNSGGQTSFSLVAGTNPGMTAQLSRLVARVSISSIKTAFDPNGQFSGASYQLKNIFVRDAVKEVVPGVGGYTNTKMGTPAYLTGSYNGSTGTPVLATTVNPAVNITSTAHTVNYWFYIFPNEESTHTALVLEGTFKRNASDTGRTMYYPIIINKNQTGTTITGASGTGDSHIRRNTTYAIKATIKGEGTTDPAGEITPTSLNLTVSVANWALNITQDVTFN